MSESNPIKLDNDLTADGLASVAPAIVELLPPFLANQRWFGDKSRRITETTLASQSVVQIGDNLLLLAVVTVNFDSGDPVNYFVPLLASGDGSAQTTIVDIETPSHRWSVTDAVQSETFRAWLLRQLQGEQQADGASFRWTSTDVGAKTVAGAGDLPSRVSSAQQSNSSIVYGDAVIVKLFRRLSTGINPEIELGLFLTSETSFRNMPLLLGEWSASEPGQAPVSLAVAQSYIPSIGDGWSYILETLASGSADAESAAGRLGQLTAQMHLALESAKQPGDLKPEPITADDADQWRASTTKAIETTANALAAKRDDYDEPTRELIDAFIAQSRHLTGQTAGYERLVGRTKTRVHGDYHLGQTLRTTDDDFVILDFEGEPARPIEERRLRTSPFKDVAGMLRSFGYARGAAERASADTDRAALVAWERSARRAFIDQYVAESRAGGARYLPDSADDIRQAIAAWELDKALYEVAYELNNRPDWLALPLAATLKLT